MTDSRISVQTADFDVGAEYQALAQNSAAGAVVTFVGKVRDMNLGDEVSGLSLEHYPGMTEKALSAICDEAEQRWELGNVRVIHRVGALTAGEQIVFVGVTSAHRSSAFSACEFIMDYLKTRAPFWKKEQLGQSSRWVEARSSDHESAQRWKKSAQ